MSMQARNKFAESLVELIEAYTQDEDETNEDVREVLYYLMARSQLVMDTVRFTVLKQVPDAEKLAVHVTSVLGMETSLNMSNAFFRVNEQAIRGAIKSEEIAISSLLEMIKSGDRRLAKMIPGTVANRFSSMSLIISLAFGDVIAREFDMALRERTAITAGEEAAFMAILNKAS